MKMLSHLILFSALALPMVSHAQEQDKQTQLSAQGYYNRPPVVRYFGPPKMDAQAQLPKLVQVKQNAPAMKHVIQVSDRR